MITKKLFGFGLKQREAKDSLIMFAFYARAKDIRSWTGVRRVKEIEKGAQRVLIPARVNAIKRFISSNEQNTIPGAILIAFNEKVVSLTNLSKQVQPCAMGLDISNNCDELVFPAEMTFLFDDTLPEHERPAMIVDGQHRLYGLSAYDKEDIPLLVVALVDAPVMEQAFQFVVINNKSVRVATHDVKSIIADIDENVLQERLLTAGIKYGEKSPILRDLNDLVESPFRNLLDWNYNIRKGGQGLIPLTAVEQSLRYINILFETVLEGSYEEGDEDSLLQLFMAMWRSVKNYYSDLWGVENKLMTKVAINALNEILTDKLKAGWEFGLVDIFEIESVENFVTKLLDSLLPDFWLREWFIPVQDNANVRKLIKSDLETLAENKKMRRPWYTDLQLPIHDSTLQ